MSPRAKVVKRRSSASSSISAARSTRDARIVGNYQVVQPGRNKHSAPQRVTVLAAQISTGGKSVTLTLAKYNARKPLSLKATGLFDAAGASVITFVTEL